MKVSLRKLIIIAAAAFIFISPAKSQAPLPDSLFFKSLIANYAEALNLADTNLARNIWAPTAEISFINPAGTEYGWEGIKNIYQMFHDNFTSRKLSFYNLRYSYYGDVSWMTFYWIFDATLKAGNQVVQTRGRETQIWKKINYEWRLVHVHYSGMPVTATGQGF